jgi:hypothetical protein
MENGGAPLLSRTVYELTEAERRRCREMNAGSLLERLARGRDRSFYPIEAASIGYQVLKGASSYPGCMSGCLLVQWRLS